MIAHIFRRGPYDQNFGLRSTCPKVAAGGNATVHVKRFFDIAIALMLIGFSLPFFLLMAGTLALVQGGPVFIKHRRIGRNGLPFECLKFRSMVTNAERVLASHLDASAEARLEWQATRKLRNDPRITPLGRAIRRSSVDELPQLFNVLRGDMSLVGPRPIVAAEVALYGPDITDYYRVRPGLTGLWQISGRSNTSYDVRVQLDVDYVQKWSFSRDLMILVKTLPAVARAAGSY